MRLPARRTASCSACCASRGARRRDRLLRRLRRSRFSPAWHRCWRFRWLAPLVDVFTEGPGARSPTWRWPVRVADAGGAVVRVGARLAARGGMVSFCHRVQLVRVDPADGRGAGDAAASVSLSAPGVTEDSAASAVHCPALRLRAVAALVPGTQGAGAVGRQGVLLVLIVNAGHRGGRDGAWAVRRRARG